MLLLALMAIGAVLFPVSWFNGTIYALLIVPALIATILRIWWCYSQGQPLTFESRVATFAGSLLLLWFFYAVVLLQNAVQ